MPRISKAATSRGNAFIWLNLSDLPDSAFANFDSAPPPTSSLRAEAEEIESLFADAYEMGYPRSGQGNRASSNTYS